MPASPISEVDPLDSTRPNEQWTAGMSSLPIGARPCDNYANQTPSLRRRNALVGEKFTRSNENSLAGSDQYSGVEGSEEGSGVASVSSSTQAVVGQTTSPLPYQLENQAPVAQGESLSAGNPWSGSVSSGNKPGIIDQSVQPEVSQPSMYHSGSRSGGGNMPSQSNHPSDARSTASTRGAAISGSQRHQLQPALPSISSTLNRNNQLSADQMNIETPTQGTSNSRNISPNQNQGAGGGPLTQKTASGASYVSVPQDQRNNNARPQGSNNVPNRGPRRNTTSSGTAPLQRHGQSNTHNLTLDQLSQRFRGRVSEVRTYIDQSTGVPSTARNQIRQKVDQINREYNDVERKSQEEYKKLHQEMVRLQAHMDEVTSQLQDVVQDRQRISAERDSLLLKQQLGFKKATSSERLKVLEEEFRVREAELLTQIDIQEQQLSGRRALWMSSNPGSSARRKEMEKNHDPFNSPLAGHTPNLSSGSMTTMGSAPVQTPSKASFGSAQLQLYGHQATPPQMDYPSSQKRSSRRMNLPTGTVSIGMYGTQPNFHNQRLSTIITEPYTEPDLHRASYDDLQPPPTAVVLHSKEEKLANEYRVLFNQLFNRIEGWARTYTTQPNADNDRAIASSNQSLWEFMMGLAYPTDKASSHTHIVALLNDAKCRHWFIMRMITSYLTREITSHIVFRGFSTDVDRVLADVERELGVRGLANERRQVLIDQKASAIQSLVSSAKYSDFRNMKFNQHTKALRNMLGPLLNVNASRAVAGKELADLVIKTWDIAVKMATSHVTFQIFFPETANKFCASTMDVKDNKTDPMKLQLHQARLKLVITPVVTLRDDRGTTIIAKSILNSNVLVMG